MFVGFNKNGEDLYDTKEAAIDRAKMLIAHNGPADILVQKEEIPLWFAHLVKGTWFERFAYYRIKGD